MPVLGAATLELNADSAKLEQDLGRAVTQAAAMGTAIGTVIGQGISAGIDKLRHMVNTSIEVGDELNKLSQKTGMSVENLSELRVAAELSNVSLNTLKGGVAGLYEKISQAGRVDGKSRSAFEAIGLDVEKLRALKPDELFKTVTERLAQYGDGANRAALQTATLGAAGKELSPFINELGKTTALARELGITMDKETAEAAERFKDNMTVGRIASEAMGNRIATVLLPTLEKLSGYLVENAKNTERLDTVTRAADTGLKLFATAGTIVATVFGIVGDKIGAAFATASLVLKGEFTEAAKTAGGTVVATGRRIGEAVGEIQGIWDEAGNKAQAGAEANGKKLAAPALDAVDKIKKARKEADAEFAAFLKIKAIESETDAATQKYYADEGRKKEEARAKEIADRELMMKQVYEFGDAQDEAFMKGEQIAARVGEKVAEVDDIGKKLGLTFTSAFEDAVVGGKKFSEILKGIEQDVARIILRKGITEPVGNAVSNAVTGSGIGDWLKKILPSFDVGTSYVPHDMIAQIHEGEEIIPKGGRSEKAAAPVNINFTVNAMDSRSFAQSMASNRSLIIGIVNQALEKSGQPGMLPA